MGKKLILSLAIVVALGLGVAFWLFQTPPPEPEAMVTGIWLRWRSSFILA